MGFQPSVSRARQEGHKDGPEESGSEGRGSVTVRGPLLNASYRAIAWKRSQTRCNRFKSSISQRTALSLPRLKMVAIFITL